MILVTGLNTAKAQVRADYDKAANFGQYHTYALLTPDLQTGTNPLYKSKLVTYNIEATLKNELSRRGLTMNRQQPDLLIGYHAFTQKRTQMYAPYGGLSPYGYGGFSPYGGFGGYGGYGGYGYRRGPYTYGTLVLDVADAQTHKSIWRGTITGDVSNPRRIDRTVARAVHRLMHRYPVRAS